MPKIPIYNAHDIRPNRRGSKIIRLAGLVAVGLALAVPLGEGISLCISQWCEVMGKNNQVRTPVLDSVNDRVQSTHETVGMWMSEQFQRVPWDPGLVLPIAGVVMVLGILMLKR